MTLQRLTQPLTVHENAYLSTALRAIGARHHRWAVWLVPATYIGCIAAFITDLRSADTLAFGVFYAPLVATAVFHRDRRAVWVLTAIACVMNIIGAFVPAIAKDVSDMVWNRSLSTLALLATGAFTWHARSIQERLCATDRTRGSG